MEALAVLFPGGGSATQRAAARNWQRRRQKGIPATESFAPPGRSSAAGRSQRRSCRIRIEGEFDGGFPACICCCQAWPWASWPTFGTRGCCMGPDHQTAVEPGRLHLFEDAGSRAMLINILPALSSPVIPGAQSMGRPRLTVCGHRAGSRSVEIRSVHTGDRGGSLAISTLILLAEERPHST